MLIRAIGWRADSALRAGGDGRVRVIAPLAASVYVEARGEILWIGGPATVSHSRAIHASAPPAGLNAGDTLRVALAAGLTPWRPPPAPATADAAHALRCAVTRLATSATRLGTPRGLGSWLLGTPLAFPLDAVGARAAALADACIADDPRRAAEAATTLLGLGPGLTPAGDDFVGGAFFARALLRQAGVIDATAWQAAAERVASSATQLTHPIGAALLGDLLGGEGWAPLHALAAHLARDDDDAALDAARRLTELGHSSGWDLLAGFISGARR